MDRGLNKQKYKVFYSEINDDGTMENIEIVALYMKGNNKKRSSLRIKNARMTTKLPSSSSFYAFNMF